MSHRVNSDQEKLKQVCHLSKISILNEITRSISNNQLDYIPAQKELADRSFATSFQNFISDHKEMTVRMGLHDNKCSKEFEMELNFDRESHLKAKDTYAFK